MLSAFLFFLGITLIYTGFLASARDLITGIAVSCLGLVLIVKPVLDALRYFRTGFGGGPHPHRDKILQNLKVKKVHLKIVKSEDDKPTIH